MNNTEFAVDTNTYISILYKDVNRLLDILYNVEKVDFELIGKIADECSNVIKYINEIENLYNIQFEQQYLVMALGNIEKSVTSNNLVTLCDTMEYEILPSISYYYDTIYNLIN